MNFVSTGLSWLGESLPIIFKISPQVGFRENLKMKIVTIPHAKGVSNKNIKKILKDPQNF